MDAALQFEFTPPKAPPAQLPSERSSQTVAAYAKDQGKYRAWCAGDESREPREPLDARSVAAYLSYLATTPPAPANGTVRRAPDARQSHAYSTILRRLAGIAALFEAHDARVDKRERLGDPRHHPAVVAALGAIRKDMERLTERRARLPEGAQVEDVAARPPAPTVPIDTDGVRRIVEVIDGVEPPSIGAALRALRDRALILVLFAGAMTRDEARLLTRGNIMDLPEGLSATVNRSEFRSNARTIVILRGADPQTDPVLALELYFKATGIGAHDPVFCAISDSGAITQKPISRAQFARLVADRVRAAGLDPRLFTPHAIRSGFIFQVGRSGGTLKEALSQSGHKDAKNAQRAYQEGKSWANHPGRYLGL